jgi:hypothetical protein
VLCDVRDLIRSISRTNLLWSTPHIHGEVIKLAYEVSEATVAKYMVRVPHPPSQSWGTFMQSLLRKLVVIDFLTVLTATFKTLYAFLVLSLHRRRIINSNVMDSATAD